MNDQLNEILNDTYDESKEGTIRSMISDFYNRKMASVIILVWAFGLIFIALAVFSGVKFFVSEQVKDLVMYAVIFLASIHFIGLMKLFAWMMIHRNSIKREIKRLELRIAELTETVKNK